MSSRSHLEFIELMGRTLGDLSALLPIQDADWQRLYDCAKANRMLPLLYAAARSEESGPPALISTLKQDAQRSFVATSLTTRVLEDVSEALADIPWVLLRGPVLGQMLYGDLMLRPYGDLDVLVAPSQVNQALEWLNKAGFCQPASAFPDHYYRRYHLHIALERPGLAGPTALELHWALDHPFALLTVDVQRLLDRRITVRVNTLVIPCLALEDLLVALSIHAVKHAALLPLWIEQQRPEALAANGMLLHFYDIALAIARFGDQLNWQLIADRSRQWGAIHQVTLCLQAVQMLWPASTHPPFALFQTTRRLPYWRRLLLDWSSKVNPASAFRQLRGAFFRPIRLIDGVHYLLPPGDYLMRRYGQSSMKVRASHLAHALTEFGAGMLQLAYLSAKGLFRKPAKRV